MKHNNNQLILWVVIAAALLIGLYFAKDKIAGLVPGMNKNEVVEVAEVVETPNSLEVTEVAAEPMADMPGASEEK